jgi:hypothetical protein
MVVAAVVIAQGAWEASLVSLSGALEIPRVAAATVVLLGVILGEVVLLEA